MNPYPSRHQRPAALPGFFLQPRDRLILQNVYRHRYVLARHVAQLNFKGSLRAAQRRLRLLWERRYLDRLFLPLQHDGGVRLSPPLYSLARAGAEIVACDIDVAPCDIPHTPKANAVGFATMAHNLIATDLLVSAECANTEHRPISTQQEFHLRRKLATARMYKNWRGQGIVPDGALTLFPRGNIPDLFRRGNDRPQTFYLEVVRASVRSGNQSLVRKCSLFAKLHHDGYFRIVFGHEHIRAVLILTTSNDRAERLRQLMANLRHGRNLFWFGVCTPRPPGSLAPAAIAEHLTSPMWRNLDGQSVAIIHRLAAPPPVATQPHV